MTLSDFLFVICIGSVLIIPLAACLAVWTNREPAQNLWPLAGFTRESWKVFGIAFGLTLVVSIFAKLFGGEIGGVMFTGIALSFAMAFIRSGRRDTDALAISSLCLIAVVVSACTAIYQLLGIADAEGTLHYDFQSCLYFSVITFMTVGYGDLHPEGYARAVAAGEALAQYFVLGTVLYLLTTQKPTSPNPPQ